MIFKPFYDDYEFVKRPVFTSDLSDHPTFQFYTYDDGLDIPVFHVVPTQDYKDIAVCLFEPRFYQYTRDTYTMDHFLLDEFDKVLRETYDGNFKDGPKTNWEVLVMHWLNDHCADNPKLKDKIEKKYIDLTIQPDYTKLEDNPIMKRGFKRAFIAKWNA